MQTEVLYSPAYSLAKVALQPGEQLRAESGAMVSMSGGIRIETQATGGFMKSLSRAVLGGESFFQNTFHADSGGEVTLAPRLPGDIMVFDLDNHEALVQSGSYLGSSTGITIDAKWGGAKSFFASEGLFMLKCTGSGPLIISSYGAIHRVTILAGESYVVDTGHIVGFPTTMTYSVRKAGSLKSTVFGGEGLVCEFQGPGDLFLQTRSPSEFLSWLIPLLPNNRSN
ncbi:MAG TPA: TIGR00266 family protein [Thermomicrobiales bacterium]|nr:TIGR00266 family protein [Thermomicrobiales bacterium]